MLPHRQNTARAESTDRQLPGNELERPMDAGGPGWAFKVGEISAFPLRGRMRARDQR